MDPLSTVQSYKIVVDPYFKHFSNKKYRYTLLEKIVYNFMLLDFPILCHLIKWLGNEEIMHESAEEIIYSLRNQGESIVLRETVLFEKF